MVRALKGLEKAISITIVDPIMGKDGWNFSTNQGGCTLDPIMNATHLRQVYFAAEPNYSARFTVPCLWDKKEKTIVNNESSEIMNMISSAFNSIAENPQIDLYPANLKKEIDDLDDGWMYNDIQNGVYKTGFATKQDVNCTKNLNILISSHTHLRRYMRNTVPHSLMELIVLRISCQTLPSCWVMYL